MKGLLFFEAAAISTTLTGEPNVIIAGLILAKLAYDPILDDSLFYIFFGALCITLVAKLFDWKTKRDDLSSNSLEAASVVFGTCFWLSNNIYTRVGALLFYVFVLQKIEPSIIIGGLHILGLVFEPETPEELLSIVVYYTLFFGCFHISIWLWRKRDKIFLRFQRNRNDTTHTVQDPSDNTHDHND